jgi:hypothetical protein
VCDLETSRIGTPYIYIYIYIYDISSLRVKEFNNLYLIVMKVVGFFNNIHRFMFSIIMALRKAKYLKCGSYIDVCGLDSVVGIATGYGLGGPGIESRWGRDYPHLSSPALGPIQPPLQWVPGLCRGEKATGV